jgi:BREX system ATP-binding protein BrxC/D
MGGPDGRGPGTAVPALSAARRAEVIDALRRGTVPRAGLDLFAVGLDRFARAVDEELDGVAAGRATFKAVRGEYGAGKTFFARWLAERAKRRGMAVAEVQISETETPLHKLETVYRRLVEQLSTAASPSSALKDVVDAWFYTLEEDVLAEGKIAPDDAAALRGAVDQLLEARLAAVARTTPAFAAALRAYWQTVARGDQATAQSLLAWIGGQPNVAAAARRAAGVKGDLDHFAALGFLQGLLTILRDSGHPGLLVVLDETETLQRVRTDVRDKGLNALRQLIDDVDAGRFPGLYLLITGTPAFYDGPQGITRLTPLMQRLVTDFGTDPRFDSPRAVQVRLTGFDLAKLAALGTAIRDVYADGLDAAARARIAARVDDAYLADLAQAVAGELGGQAGVAPRLFLRKLVADVLDRVAEFADFDPCKHYKLTLSTAELTDTERSAAAFRPQTADDVELDL